MVGRFYISQETMDKFFKLRSYGREMEKLVTNSFIIESGCHPDVPIMVTPVFENPDANMGEAIGMHWEQEIDRELLYDKLYPEYDTGMSVILSGYYFLN